MLEWQNGKHSLARRVSQSQDDLHFLFYFSLYLLIFRLEKKVIFLFIVTLAILSLWPLAFGFAPNGQSDSVFKPNRDFSVWFGFFEI